jgi:hypothetical protein
MPRLMNPIIAQLDATALAMLGRVRKFFQSIPRLLTRIPKKLFTAIGAD